MSSALISYDQVMLMERQLYASSVKTLLVPTSMCEEAKQDHLALLQIQFHNLISALELVVMLKLILAQEATEPQLELILCDL